MIPLYGFLEGDTIGLLVFAEEADTMADLARKLQASAALRVAPRERVRVVFKGRLLDPALALRDAGLEALDRFDVVEDRP
jgi:hypothetical protein